MAAPPVIQRIESDKARVARALEALGWPSEPALEAQLVQLRRLAQQDTRGRDRNVRQMITAREKLLNAVAAIRSADQTWREAREDG